MMLAGIVLAFGFAGAAVLAFLGISAVLQPDRWPEDLRGWVWLAVVGLSVWAVYAITRWLAQRTKSIF